jgi:hypothetical protein
MIEAAHTIEDQREGFEVKVNHKLDIDREKKR